MTATRFLPIQWTQRVTVFFAIIGGILAMPVLCDTGVAEHGCICETSDCCDTEALCELDPCSDAYKTEEWLAMDTIPAEFASPTLDGSDGLAAMHGTYQPYHQVALVNLPLPKSDLPLLI